MFYNAIQSAAGFFRFSTSEVFIFLFNVMPVFSDFLKVLFHTVFQDVDAGFFSPISLAILNM